MRTVNGVRVNEGDGHGSRTEDDTDGPGFGALLVPGVT